MLLYGCETWPISDNRKKGSTSSIFAAYDPSSTFLGMSHDHTPNTTIIERTGAPDIFSPIVIYRLRWSGHVCRMEDGWLPKDVLYGQLPSAPRPAGRPKLRYKDVLKRD